MNDEREASDIWDLNRPSVQKYGRTGFPAPAHGRGPGDDSSSETLGKNRSYSLRKWPPDGDSAIS